MSEHNSEEHAHSPSRSPSGPTRYWCHHCGREVPIYMAPDPTCQRCNEQFIEEIDDGGDDPRAFMSEAHAGANGDEQPGEDDIFQFFRGAVGGGGGTTTGARFHFTTSDEPSQQGNTSGGGAEGGSPVGTMLQNVLNLLSTGGNNNTNGGNTDTNDTNNRNNDNNNTESHWGETNERGQRQQQRRPPMIFYSGVVDGNMQFRPINIQTNLGGDGSGRQAEGGGATAFFQMGETNNQQTEGDNAEGDNAEGDNTEGGTGREGWGENTGNNLQSFLQLISALTGTPMDAGLVGNPNDYVFSQAALDNIITQLMEQTAGRTAPPPAPEDVIDRLPKRVLSEQEFKEQVDCAVCKDEFNQSEMVIELPCQHVFHDDCIKPWLKMNGTCPVCRHSVVPTSSEVGNNDNDPTTPANESSSQQPEREREGTDEGRDAGERERSSSPPSYSYRREPQSTSNTNNTEHYSNDQSENTTKESATSRSSSSSNPSDPASSSTHRETSNNTGNGNSSNNMNNNNNNSSNANTPSAASAAFAWFTNARSHAGSPVASWTGSPSWSTNIPGAFTWGPGNNNNNSNNNNDYNSNNRNDNHSAESQQSAPDMDLDLD